MHVHLPTDRGCHVIKHIISQKFLYLMTKKYHENDIDYILFHRCHRLHRFKWKKQQSDKKIIQHYFYLNEHSHYFISTFEHWPLFIYNHINTCTISWWWFYIIYMYTNALAWRAYSFVHSDIVLFFMNLRCWKELSLF